MTGGFWRGLTDVIGRVFSVPGRRVPTGVRQVVDAPGMPSTMGTVTSSLQIGAVWACCRLLSQSVATLPGHVFATTDAGKVRATSHPLYRLLTLQPNPIMTLQHWLQTTVLHLMLYGNSYTLPERQEGEVFALWPLVPDRVRIVLDRETGQYKYRYSTPTGQPVEFLPGEVLHFRLFSLDGITGLSPIEYHRLTFEIDAVSRLYAATLYANGGRPAGVFTTPGPLNKTQVDNMRESWRAMHAGPGNAGSVVILEGGAKYEALAIPPEHLEYIAQQKFSVEQIARIYGVPPHLIGAMDKPTYASVEQQALEFLQYTLQPIVTAIERNIQSVLLTEPFFYKLNIAAFERSDIKTRYTAYGMGRQWGWLSVNDIRELEDLNRIPEGDVYLQPLNMTPAQAGVNANEGG